VLAHNPAVWIEFPVQTPYVEVYRDSLFGGFMFRDPYAACTPMPDCQTTPALVIGAKPVLPVAANRPRAPQNPGAVRSVQTCPSG
jgi:hypothetical protein